MQQCSVAVLCTLYIGDDCSLADLALCSILGQNCISHSIRVYLYIDGPISTDHSKLVEKFRPQLYMIVAETQNRGLPVGLNSLIECLTDEEYLFRMDLDDISHPDRFRCQIDFMTNNPHVDICGCNSIDIDEFGNSISSREYPENHEDIVASLPRCNPILHPTYCIRVSSLISTGLRYREVRLNEDLAFIFDAVKSGFILHNLQLPLFNWRTGEKFFRRRGFRRAVTELRTYLDGVYSIHGFSLKLIWPLLRFTTRMLPTRVTRAIYRSRLRSSFLNARGRLSRAHNQISK